jgi:thiamine biosynthesis protein ThiS
LADFLEAEGEPVGHVVVEVNSRHIREHEYQDLVLLSGDRVEIILPAFGG